MQKIAIKLRIHPPKRRTPSQRLRARLYYRRNRAKIRMQRRRYLRIHKSIIKHRKMFMRYKPTWFRKPSKHKKPMKPKKFKVVVPKSFHPRHLKVRRPGLKKPHFFKPRRTH